MSKGIKFFEFMSDWSMEEWNDFMDGEELGYRVIAQGEIPEFLPDDLTSKFNSAVVACSGSMASLFYCVNGFRVDGGSIKEHQYTVTFDRNTGDCYAGFIEHPDYDGRTTDVPTEMVNLMTASGINVDYQFTRKPSEPSGSLKDLEAKGLLTGVTNAFHTLEKKKKENNNS